MTDLLTRRDNLIVLAAVILFLIHCGVYFGFTVDDSYISYRFARNWAQGLGPVYNPGDHVEGYTSFAWVALLALAAKLGLEIETSSKVLGIASGIVCIVAVAAISRRLLIGRPTYLLAPFVLALSPLFTAWACSGMDTVLFCCVLSLAAYAIVFDETGQHLIPLSAPCLGLAALIRPEGLLFGAAAFFSIVATRGKTARSLIWAKWMTMFALVTLPVLVWRYSYYGSLLPNTYYAKTGRGLERLLSGGWSVANFAEYQGLAFVALCIVGVFGMSNEIVTFSKGILGVVQKCAAWRFISLTIPAFIAYVVWVGGDFLHIRFFVHIMGLLAICAAVGFDQFAAGWRWEDRRRLIATYSTIGLVWICLTSLQDYRALTAHHQFGVAYMVSNSRNIHKANIPLGKWLHAHAPVDSSVAVWDIGGLGYYSNLRIIDMYGLVDRELAYMIHSKASNEKKAAYVLSQQPDFIVTYATPGKPDLQWLSAGRDWINHNYIFHSYWRGGPDGYGLALLVRRDLIPLLPSDRLP